MQFKSVIPRDITPVVEFIITAFARYYTSSILSRYTLYILFNLKDRTLHTLNF